MQQTKTTRRFAGCAGTITGTAAGSMTEGIARRQVSAGYDYLKANPAAKPKFKKVTKTITMLVPVNEDAKQLISAAHKGGMYLEFYDAEKVLNTCIYAAKIGWQKYQEELDRNERLKLSPALPIKITELVKQFNKLHSK